MSKYIKKKKKDKKKAKALGCELSRRVRGDRDAAAYQCPHPIMTAQVGMDVRWCRVGTARLVCLLRSRRTL